MSHLYTYAGMVTAVAAVIIGGAAYLTSGSVLLLAAAVLGLLSWAAFKKARTRIGS